MKKIALILCCALASTLFSGCTVAVIGAGAAAGGASQMSGDRRTVGSMVDDSAIESVAIQEIEMIDKIGFSDSSIGTTSINGTLLVFGQTKSKLIYSGLEKTCMKIKGVKKVYNAVTISENSGFGQTSQDSWITTKVKTKLIGESGIRSNSVKVITENAVVYLLGLVTRDEGQIAARLAADTDGVQKVVTLFEYVTEKEEDGTAESKTISSNSNNEKSEVQVPSPSQHTLSADTIEVDDL